jgi:glycosyltransferase involved in cell wall biosynthesis
MQRLRQRGPELIGPIAVQASDGRARSDMPTLIHREPDDAAAPVRVLQVAASVAIRDGGPSTAVLNINRSLRAQGSDSIVLATTADGPRDRLIVDTNAPQADDGTRVWFCRRSRPWALKNSWELARRARELAPTVGVVHIHGVYLANSIWGMVAARHAGVPYVVQPHGAFEPYQEARHRWRKRTFNASIGNRIVRSASLLIAASQTEADNLARRWPGTPVAVVPLGFADPQPQAPPPSPGLAAWLDHPRERRVVFLGRLASKKRPDVLIDAWNVVQGAGHLLVVGPPDDWRPERLLARLDSERRPTAAFLDGVPPAQAAWILDRAGVFVLPSANENFGIAVVEAMSHGCAVVTTAQTAACAHVAEADAGIVLPEPSLAPLAQTLTDLLAAPQRVAELGARGRTHAHQHLTWAATAARLHEAYAGTLRAKAT